jgi:hypothetical protein
MASEQPDVASRRQDHSDVATQIGSIAFPYLSVQSSEAAER